jgi:hypothetical protein
MDNLNCRNRLAGSYPHFDVERAGSCPVSMFDGASSFVCRCFHYLTFFKRGNYCPTLSVCGQGLAVLALIVSLGGCTTNVVVEGSVPTPLVVKIPAVIGVHFSDEFKTFKYKEVMRETGTWKIDLGEQNLSFFRNLLSSMFTSVEEVSEPPFQSGEMQDLDGVIVPRIVKYGFLTPAISGLKFYSASIQYQILLYNSSGEVIGDWNIVGYGKSEGGSFGADDALGDATMLAIRDGGARIAIEMSQQPQVVAWIENLNSAEVE